MSKLIVIEGPDRVGKATQCRMLRTNLEAMGFKATVVEVPVEDAFTHAAIYRMLENGLAKKLPKVFQVLQVLNRKIFQETRLLELEHDNDFIIFDRWSLSTSIYGAASGLPQDMIDVMYRQLRRPDFTFVLLGEAHPHEAEDVYEADKTLQIKVRNLYGEWAVQHPDESHAIDSTQSKDTIAAEMMTVLKVMRIIPRRNIVLS